MKPIVRKRRHKLANRKPDPVTPGVCRECGCTDVTACWHDEAGPCGWADRERTLCTHCAQGLDDVERFSELPAGLKP